MNRESFHEEQRLTQWWIWVLIVGFVALGVWMFVQQIVLGEPFGDNPAPDAAVWVLAPLVAIVLPGGLALLRLKVTVDDEALRIRFVPFFRRVIPRREIRHAEATTYRPIREYLGWGIRWSPTRGWCYTIAGDRGVRLELKDGKKLLVGSRRGEELVEALGLSRR